MSIRQALRNLRADLYERFLNFETLNAWMVLIPWGAGFIYCGLYNEKMGYKYTLVSVGVVLIIRGLRNGTVNRIKYWNKVEELQEERKNRVD